MTDIIFVRGAGAPSAVFLGMPDAASAKASAAAAAASNTSAAGHDAAAAVSANLAAQNAIKADLLAAPRDPVGLWAIDQYDATNRYIPNLVASSQLPSANLRRMSRHNFNSFFWVKDGAVVVTDRSEIGLSGQLDAARIQIPAGKRLAFSTQSYGAIPAGTYTVAATIMRKGGTDQTFVFGSTSTLSAKSAVQTATSAFQRFFYTFTLATAQWGWEISLAAPDGSTATDLIVDNIELYSGSSDLGPMTAQMGHIYLGRSHGETLYIPSFSGGILSCPVNGSPTALGSAILPSRYAATKWTFSALVRKSSAQSYGYIAADLDNYQNFSPSPPQGTAAAGPMPVTTVQVPNNQMENVLAVEATVGAQAVQYPGLTELLNKDFHQWTFTYDGIAEEIWMDDVRMFRRERTLTARNLQDLLFFSDVNMVGIGFDIGGVIGLWDRCLTADEIRNFYYHQRSRQSLTIKGLRNNRILVVEGDSNHDFDISWPWKFGPNASPSVLGSVWATGGSRLDHSDDASFTAGWENVTLANRASTVDAMLPANTYGRTFILTVGIGTNDLLIYPGASDAAAAAAYITSLRSYCMARAAAGWQVCLFTIPPRAGGGFNARRNIINADIRTNWALYGLASAGRIIDIAADTTIGTDTSQTDHPTYWQGDGIHFTDLGQQLVETIARPVINAIP